MIWTVFRVREEAVLQTSYPNHQKAFAQGISSWYVVGCLKWFDAAEHRIAWRKSSFLCLTTIVLLSLARHRFAVW